MLRTCFSVGPLIPTDLSFFYSLLISDPMITAGVIFKKSVVAELPKKVNVYVSSLYLLHMQKTMRRFLVSKAFSSLKFSCDVFTMTSSKSLVTSSKFQVKLLQVTWNNIINMIFKRERNFAAIVILLVIIAEALRSKELYGKQPVVSGKRFWYLTLIFPLRTNQNIFYTVK